MQLTLSELYHIMMMITGLWAMICSIIYLKAFLSKNKQNNNYNRRKKK